MKKMLCTLVSIILLVTAFSAVAYGGRYIESYDYYLDNTTTSDWAETVFLRKINTGQNGINNVSYYTGQKNAAYKLARLDFIDECGCYFTSDATNILWQKTGRYALPYKSGYGHAGDYFQLNMRRNTDDPVPVVHTIGSFSPDTTD